jgi:hypothetical protein
MAVPHHTTAAGPASAPGDLHGADPSGPSVKSPPRLRLEQTSARTSLLDGGWWPQSSDAGVELPALIATLDHFRGPISHVLLNTTQWSLPHPRQIAAAGRTVRLGWYTSQPAGLLTLICDFDRGRIDLLVVPAQATAACAATAMTAAATPGNRQHTPALLADITCEN